MEVSAFFVLHTQRSDLRRECLIKVFEDSRPKQDQSGLEQLGLEDCFPSPLVVIDQRAFLMGLMGLLDERIFLGAVYVSKVPCRSIIGNAFFS